MSLHVDKNRCTLLSHLEEVKRVFGEVFQDFSFRVVSKGHVPSCRCRHVEHAYWSIGVYRQIHKLAHKSFAKVIGHSPFTSRIHHSPTYSHARTHQASSENGRPGDQGPLLGGARRVLCRYEGLEIG